jgi:hypothetical protein
MAGPNTPENFSTTLLSMLFSLVREEKSREVVLNLQVTVADGTKPLGELFPLSHETEVWMCRDLWSVWPGGQGATPEDERLYAGKKPDVWCEDTSHVLFIENKVGGGRKKIENQKSCYLGFLRKQRLNDKKKGLLYAVPEGWTVNPGCEWLEFVQTPDGSVVRGLLKWNAALVGLVTDLFNVPKWFATKLPNRIGTQYL